MGLLKKTAKHAAVENEPFAIVLQEVSSRKDINLLIQELVTLFPITETDAKEIIKNLPIILVDNVRAQSAAIIRDRILARGGNATLVQNADEKKRIGVFVEFDCTFDIEENLRRQLALSNRRQAASTTAKETEFTRVQKTPEKEPETVVDRKRLSKTIRVSQYPGAPIAAPAAATASRVERPGTQKVSPTAMMANEFESLRRKLQGAEEAYRDQEKEIKAAQITRRELEKKVGELTLEIELLRQGGGTKTEMAAEVERLRARVEELTAQLDKAQGANAGAGEALAEQERLQARVDELAAKMEKARVENAREAQTLEAQAKAEQERLHARISELTAQLDKAHQGESAEVSEVRAEQKRLQAQVDELTDQLEKARTESAHAARLQAEKAEAEQDRLRNRVNELTSGLDKAQKENAETGKAKAEQKRLQGLVDELTAKLEKAEREAQARTDKAQTEQGQLRTRIDELSASVEQTRVAAERVKPLETECERLSSQVGELNTLLTKAHDDALKAGQKSGADEEARKQLQARTERMENELSEAFRRADEANERLGQVQGQLQEREAQLQQIRQQLEFAQSAHGEQAAEWGRKVSGLEAATAAAAQDKRALGEQLDAVQKQAAEREDAGAREREKLAGQLRDQAAEAERTRNEAAAARKDAETLRAECERLSGRLSEYSAVDLEKVKAGEREVQELRDRIQTLTRDGVLGRVKIEEQFQRKEQEYIDMIEGLKSRMLEMEGIVGPLRVRIEELEGLVQTLSGEKNDLLGQVVDLRQHSQAMPALEQRCKDMDGRVKALADEKNDLLGQIIELRQKAAGMPALERQNKDLEDRAKALTNEKNDLMGQVVDLRRQAAVLPALERQIKDHESRGESASAQIDSLEKQRVEQQKKIQELTRESQSRQHQIDELTVQCESGIRMMQDIKEKLGAREEQISTLLKEAEAQRTRSRELEMQVSQAQMKALEERKRIETDLEMAKAEVEYRKGALEKSAREIVDFKKNVADKAAEIARLQMQTQELTLQVHKVQDEGRREIERLTKDMKDGLYYQVYMIDRALQEAGPARTSIEDRRAKIDAELGDLENRLRALTQKLSEVDRIEGISGLLREQQKQEFSNSLDHMRAVQAEKQEMKKILQSWQNALDHAESQHQQWKDAIQSRLDGAGIPAPAEGAAKMSSVSAAPAPAVKPPAAPAGMANEFEPAEEEAPPPPPRKPVAVRPEPKPQPAPEAEAEPESTRSAARPAAPAPETGSIKKGGLWNTRFKKGFSKFTEPSSDASQTRSREESRAPESDRKETAGPKTAMSGAGTQEIEKYRLKLNSYTVAQLQDILNHINPDKFPDKFAAVQEELNSRKK